MYGKNDFKNFDAKTEPLTVRSNEVDHDKIKRLVKSNRHYTTRDSLATCENSLEFG